MTVVFVDRLLHVLELADARLLVDLRFLPDYLDLLLLLVLDLGQLSSLLFEELLGSLLKVLLLLGGALFALEEPLKTVFFALHLTEQLV